MKNLKLILLICFLYSSKAMAQTTYTWNVNSGNFLAPNSWLPARNFPDTNDVLIFDGNNVAICTVNNLRTQTIGRLVIKNNAKVNFATAIAEKGIGEYEFGVDGRGPKGTRFSTQLKKYDIITDSIYSTGLHIIAVINDSSFFAQGALHNNFVFDTVYRSFYIQPQLKITEKSSTTPSFEITPGAALQINCSAPSLSIFIGPGAFANIGGALDIAPFALTITSSMLTAIDSNSIRIKDNGKITISEKQFISIFRLLDNTKEVIFDSGAVYEEKELTYFNSNISKNPFTFLSGSTFIYNGVGIIRDFTGHYYSDLNFSNFIYKNDVVSPDYTLAFVNCTMENLQIDSGNVQVTVRDNLIIKKNIIVKPMASVVFSPEINLTGKITFGGNTLQEIKGEGSIQFKSELPKRLDITLDNNFGLKLGNDINIINCNLILKNGAFDLNNNNLTLGMDSINRGNLLASNGYLKGNGVVTKWFPSNNLFTQNLDSNIFPFGFGNQRRNIWVVGNFTQSGTISISHNNIGGMFSFIDPFSDSNTTVKNRQNYNWQIVTANGLKGNNITIRAQGNLDSGYINLPTNIRLTLANGKAPGLAQNGIGTPIAPIATRTQLNDAELNNTFFLGANTTICIPPPPPTANNTVICEGSSSTLNGIGVGTISWYTDSINGIFLKSGISFNTPLLNHITTYYVQDSTCGASKRTKVIVSVLPKPKIGFTLNNGSQCINNTLVFTDTSVVGQGNINRLWKLNNLDTSTNINFTKNFNNAGSYTIQLIITDNLNICKDSLSKTFNIYPKPQITISANSPIICQGETIKLSGNGAKTYNWNNNIINNEPFKPLVNTNYKLIGIDSNGCIDSAFISIVVNANPIVNILSSQNPVCAKTPVKLTATGGNLYFWTDGIINGELFVPLSSKTYRVKVLNEEGCSDSAIIKLDVTPLPNVEITKNKTILTATQTEANYQWLNCNTNSIIANANAQNYTAKVNGNYAVIVSRLGCKDTSICLNINSVGIVENETLVLKVYPNPASRILNIITNNIIKTVLIYNVTGELVKEQNFENVNLKKISLTIDNLAQGIYFVQIIDEVNAKQTSRFIKE
jgi:hypothetical protein